jgi:hypothetical protein
MKNTRSKNNGTKRHLRMLAILLVPLVALILGAAAPELWAGDDKDDDELEFEETWFNIEFNFSDQDLGVRGFVDGEPWKEVEIENPKGRTIAEVEAKKRMAKQGFAELFFESGEPTLEEVSIKKFLKRFPEGTYEFEGETIEGEEIEGEAEFTHVIPCGPAGLSASGDPIVITWDFVTQVVDLDNSEFDKVSCIDPEDPEDLDIVGYRVEVEWEEVLNEGTEDEEEIKHRFGIDLKADQNSVTVPPEFIPSGQDYQYEVLVVEASGNQTITEAEETAP